MTFTADLQRGKVAEQRVVALFVDDFNVEPATTAEDRAGVDYWFGRGGIRIGVQIKADDVAARTKNLFIETVSVDATAAPGWALTPKADVLLYLVQPNNLLHIIPMRFIESHLGRWRQVYSERATRDELNNGYRTRGVCVPVAEFELCTKRFCPPLVEATAK